MAQVKSGDKIKVHYHGKLTSGKHLILQQAGNRWNLKWQRNGY